MPTLTTKQKVAASGAVVVAATVGTLLVVNSIESEGPALSVALTNFNEVAHANPAYRVTAGSIVLLRGNELSVTTNTSYVDALVFCTNALVLRWPGVTNQCYDVQWTSDFVTWTNSHAWRVGADTEIVFLAPSDLPACFFRLRMLDCASVINTMPLPPPLPPPPEPPPKPLFAGL